MTLMLNELHQGMYAEEIDITFEEFAKDWLEIYSETNDVKPGTIRIREHEISKLMPYFAKLKLKDITAKKYQSAINDLKKNGYADNTLDGINRTGKMIFKKALQLEYIKKNPTEHAYFKRTKKSIEELEEEELPKYLEKEELALLLRTADEQGLEMDSLIFLCLSYTGMRIGELVALKWKDIDFEEQTISITKTYYNPNNRTTEYQLVTPKTKSSKRTIVIDERIMNSLQEHYEAQEKVRKRNPDSYYDEGFIFAKTERDLGYPIFTKTSENRMARLLKLAGLN